MASTTVTVAVAVAIFPEASVSVKVTVFSPMLEQSKLVVSIVDDTMPQLSVLDASIS